MAEFKREMALRSAIAVVVILLVTTLVLYAPFASNLGSNVTSSVGTTKSPSSNTRVYCLPFLGTALSSTNCVANVSGDTPTGVVEWSAYSSVGNVVFSPSACTLVDSSCTVSMTATPSGHLAVRADYLGNSRNPGSTGTFVPSVVTTQFRGKPAFVAVNPNTGIIYVGNSVSDSVSVVNGSTNSVVAGFKVGGSPVSLAVNPSTNRIYVADGGSSTLSVIDGATNTVIDTVSLGGGPTSVAVNPTTDLVYVAQGTETAPYGLVSVINGSTDTVIDSLAIGPEYQAIAVDPSLGRVYVATTEVCSAVENGIRQCGPNGAVAVLDGMVTRILANVTVGGGPVGLAVNPATHIVYVTNQNSGTVSVLNGTNENVVATIGVGQFPSGAAVDSTSGKVYVGNEMSGTVSVIDARNNQVTSSIKVGAPTSVAVNPVSGAVYAASADQATVSVIKEETNEVVKTIYGWGVPMSVGVNPVTNIEYVGYDGADFLSVINASTNVEFGSVLLGHQNSTYPPQTTSIAINPITDMVYAASSVSGFVTVVDGRTNTVAASILIQSLDSRLAVNPKTNMVYAIGTVSAAPPVNGTERSLSNVSVIDGSKNVVVDTVQLHGLAEGIAVNPSTNTVYAATMGQHLVNQSYFNYGTITIINGSTNAVIKSLSAPVGAWGVVVDQATNRIYVSSAAGAVYVIDGSTNTVVGAVLVGDSTLSIVVDQTTNLAYVGTCNIGLHIINGSSPYTMSFPQSNQGSASTGTMGSNLTATEITGNGVPANGEVWPPIPVSSCSYDADDVALNPVTHTIYVANQVSGTLTVIRVLV